MIRPRHVAVLMGGWSSEREISLLSGAACADAVEKLGHRVSRIDLQRDLPAMLAALASKPDVVFNALHGRYGEDGTVQGVLDILKLPYTHSGLLASAMAMHKPTAQRLFQAAGLPVPRNHVLPLRELKTNPPLPLPFVVKPVDDGSSVGVRIITGEADIAAIPEQGEGVAPIMMAEEYIPGLELTVAVLEDRPLAVTELRPKKGFYDYRAKYTAGETEHLCPAPISAALTRRCLDYALRAYQTLLCRGVARVDFRYDPKQDRLAILELNTQPGMTRLSLVPEQAAYLGISFAELVQWMLDKAQCDA